MLNHKRLVLEKTPSICPVMQVIELAVMFVVGFQAPI